MPSANAPPHKQPLLVTALMATMGAATIQLYAIGILASDLIDEFDVSRAKIGLLGAANTLVGAMLSPLVGRTADRLGARRSVLLVLIAGGFGLLATAAAPTYGMLLVVSLFAGLPQAGGNPSTNKLIVAHAPVGQRGVITGLKQGGVTLSLFLCGLTLPVAASWLGWRVGVAAYGFLLLAIAVVVLVRLPADPRLPETTLHADRGSVIEPWVYRIAVYGFLMGVTAGGILRFIPLYAEEELGYSKAVGGLAAALIGLTGMVGRVVWARRVEQGVRTRPLLTLLAGVAALVTVLLALAGPLGSWVLWPVAILTAWSIVSWNSVGMLAVIRGVNPAQAGRASGIVLLGFLLGLSVGPPMVGSIVDRTASYPTAWLVLLVGTALAVVTMATGPEPPTEPPDSRSSRSVVS